MRPRRAAVGDRERHRHPTTTAAGSLYLRGALAAVHAAIAAGTDVRGYYVWSLLDNFEWMMGYRPTFGIVAVDRATFARTVKPSAGFLGQVARANELVVE